MRDMRLFFTWGAEVALVASAAAKPQMRNQMRQMRQL
jgi:hypothetical protein